MEHKHVNLGNDWIGLDIVERLTLGYQGIEEITDSPDGRNVIDGSETSLSTIEEVTEPSKGDDVINGGMVSLRNHITIAVLSMWIIWNLVGIIEFIKTGSTVLLLTSPAILSIPLYKILGHHFHT